MNQVQTLKKRLMWIIAGILVLTILVSAGYNWYILRLNQRQVRQSVEQTLEVYMQIIEESMEGIEELLITQSLTDEAFRKIRQPRNDLDRYLAMVDKKTAFSAEIKKYKMLDGLFMYDRYRNAYIGVKGTMISNTEHSGIKAQSEKIVKTFEGENSGDTWFHVEIGGQYYLFRMILVQNIYFCAWIKPQNLIRGLQDVIENNMEYFFLCAPGGMVLNPGEQTVSISPDGTTARVDQKRYENISIRSEERGLSLNVLTENTNIRMLVGHVLVQTLLVGAMGGMVFAAVMGLARGLLLHPLDRLLMEEELRKNRAELQYLQLQTNPHFLNNCLSLIRNLVVLDRKEDAQRAAVVLGQYTRCSLNSHTTILLQQELEHVQTYYELQRLRYRERLTISVETAPELGNVMVPTMLIQTFVENSVKHQMAAGESLRVEVKISRIRSEEGDQIEISILDSGEGFDSQVLSRLGQGRPVESETGTHVGIYNVAQRLEILYGAKASVVFENRKPHGAAVHICIPYEAH